jgi:hypothetical protein
MGPAICPETSIANYGTSAAEYRRSSKVSFKMRRKLEIAQDFNTHEKVLVSP